MLQASSIDSWSVFQDGQRVALHREVPSSAAIYTRPPVGDQRPSTAATIKMVQPPVQPPEPKPLEGHGDWQCPRTSPGLLSALIDHSTERKDIADLLGGAPSPYGGLMTQHTLLLCSEPTSSTTDNCTTKPQALARRVPPSSHCDCIPIQEGGGSAASLGLAQGRLDRINTARDPQPSPSRTNWTEGACPGTGCHSTTHHRSC
jgi:hypothetical protein